MPDFDPKAHMRKIRTKQGQVDYLPLWPRILWLRADHPDATVVTEEKFASAELARFTCTITLPNGAVATGHSSCAQKEFGDYYEKAESGAIGRALAVLGYGTDAVDLAEPPPDRNPRVQLNERLTERQQAWICKTGIERGIRFSDKQQLWSTVIGIMSKAGVEMDGVADDAGIIAEEVAHRLEALPVIRQPGTAPSPEIAQAVPRDGDGSG